MKACFDSDVIIDVLQGLTPAIDEFNHYDERHISTVTWIEVMTGAARGGIGQAVRQFLNTMTIHNLDSVISDRAVKLRIGHRLRTPDAAIWATAQILDVPLVTRNTRDFPEGHPSIRIPYRV